MFFRYTKILLMIMVFILPTKVSLAKKKTKQNWIYCYNESSNRIYFLTIKRFKKNKGKCRGRTYFQGYKNHYLMEDSTDERGFPRGEPGSPMKINLNQGRSVLVTQWNNLTKNNTIIVLEPNLVNRYVKKHCVIKNFSDSFRARVNKKTGRFEVNINKPITELSEKFHRVWKACSL